MADDTRKTPHQSSDQGFASDNYDDQTAQKARQDGGHKGGEASYNQDNAQEDTEEATQVGRQDGH